MSAARTQMLDRIRLALRDIPATGSAGDPPPGRERARTTGSVEPAELFRERVEDYAATVTEARGDHGAVRDAVTEVLARHHAANVLAAPGFPERWLPSGVVQADGQPANAELDNLDGVLTTCGLAIAETGTIVLDGGPGQGVRAFTLVPDLHVCVVGTGQLVISIADAIAALEPRTGGQVRPITFVSGPSATSDIELARVEGVHGPRRLEVIVVDDALV